MSVNVQKGSTAPAPTDFFAGTYSVPRVNLMPPEIEAERGFKKVQVGLAALTIAVAGLVVGGFVWSAAVGVGRAGQARRRAAADQRAHRRAGRVRRGPARDGPGRGRAVRPGDRDGHRRALVRVPRPALDVLPRERVPQGHDGHGHAARRRPGRCGRRHGSRGDRHHHLQRHRSGARRRRELAGRARHHRGLPERAPTARRRAPTSTARSSSTSRPPWRWAPRPCPSASSRRPPDMRLTKSQLWISGTALVCVVIVLAGWFLLIAPKRAEAADLRDQTAERRPGQRPARGADRAAQGATSPSCRSARPSWPRSSSRCPRTPSSPP